MDTYHGDWERRIIRLVNLQIEASSYAAAGAFRSSISCYEAAPSTSPGLGSKAPTEGRFAGPPRAQK